MGCGISSSNDTGTPPWRAGRHSITHLVVESVGPQRLEEIQKALDFLRSTEEANADQDEHMPNPEDGPISRSAQEILDEIYSVLFANPVLLYWFAMKYSMHLKGVVTTPKGVLVPPEVVTQFAETLLRLSPDPSAMLARTLVTCVRAVVTSPPSSTTSRFKEGGAGGMVPTFYLRKGVKLRLWETPLQQRIVTMGHMLDIEPMCVDWHLVSMLLKVSSWDWRVCEAVSNVGIVRRLGKHIPEMPIHVLTTLVNHEKFNEAVKVLTLMDLNSISPELFQRLFLVPNAQNLIDTGHVGSIGTKLWRRLVERPVWNGVSFMSHNIILKIYECCPLLKVSTGVSCLFSLPIAQRGVKSPNPDELYDLWNKMNIVVVDPRTIDLKVKSQMPVGADEVAKMVRQESLDVELQLEQAIKGIPGTKSCFLCNGKGEVDLDQDLYTDTPGEQLPPSPRAQTPTEIEAAVHEFNDSIANRDVAGICRAVRRRPSLIWGNSAKQRGLAANWFYAGAWVEPEQPLPYDGNMQKAMQAQDRDAIKVIMKAKQKATQKVATEAAPLVWRKFSDGLAQQLEAAFQDSRGTVVQIDTSQGVQGDDFLDGIDVQADIDNMVVLDQTTGNTCKLRRQECAASTIDPALTSLERCWICSGTGRTSRWLEQAGGTMHAEQKRHSQLHGDTLGKNSKPPAMCLVCYSEPGKYGMSVDCEHLYCNDCLTGSFEAILAAGQFPAHCTMCRAEAGGKPPSKGEVTRPVLTFLQERGLFSKAFQYRLVTAMQRVGIRGGEALDAGEFFECPSFCGNFLYHQPPTYDVVDGNSYVRLASCPCGATVCLECMAVVKGTLIHECDKKSAARRKAERKEAAEKDEMMAFMGKIGKPCPSCKMFIEKNEGCEWMMCGCTSHGQLSDALRNGGCGIAFKWNNLEIADDPCGYKDVDGTSLRGRPITARQVGKQHPKCARPNCNFYKCTDGMKLKWHNSAPSNKPSGGGDYCCSGCRTGGAHTGLCHRIPVPGINKAALEAQIAAKRSQDKDYALIKWLSPFDAFAVRLVWDRQRVHQITATRTSGTDSLDTYLQILGVDGALINISSATSYGFSGRMNDRDSRPPPNTDTDHALKIGMPLGSYSGGFSDGEGLLPNDMVLDLTFTDGLCRITGIRGKNLTLLPFRLFYTHVPYPPEGPDAAVDEDNANGAIEWIEYDPVLGAMNNMLHSPKASTHTSRNAKEKKNHGGFFSAFYDAVKPRVNDAESGSAKHLMLDDSISERMAEVKERHKKMNADRQAQLEAAQQRNKEQQSSDLKKARWAEQDKRRREAEAEEKRKREENWRNQLHPDVNGLEKKYLELKARDIERKAILAALGDQGKGCPACGFVMMKDGGGDDMMCGCEAKAAGGTVEKALAGGGCGLGFKWSNLQLLNNDYGSPGNPANDRQWKFDPKYDPFSIRVK